MEAVKSKHRAAGTEQEKEAAERCSNIIFQAREKYIDTTREKLKEMKDGSKE